jgi:beta-glucosidase
MPTAVPVVETVTRALKAIGLSKEQLTATTKTPAEIVSSLSVHEKVFLLSGSSFVRTSGLSKFDLHPAKTSDGPTDIRGDTVLNAPHSIVIPNATALASTWDLEAIRGIGSVLGGEAKWKEVDILLAPNLNLHRDPRGGRNQESYGEDGFLAGKCGAAFGNGEYMRIFRRFDTDVWF